MNRILLVLLMVLGEGLLLAASFLFLKDLSSVEVFTLNTVVLSMVFVLLFSQNFLLSSKSTDKSHTPAGYGISWLGLILYSASAIAVVVLSYGIIYSFPLMLILQGVALFILLFFAVMGRMSRSSVKVAINEIEARKYILRDLLSQLNILEVEVKISSKLSLHSPQISKLREELRFITPSSNTEAHSLEEQIEGAILQLRRQVASYNPERWAILYERCLALIELRKGIF